MHFLLDRLEKRKRKFRWMNSGAANMPLHWHVGRPNFGDDINPFFFEAISGKPPRLDVTRNGPHLLGIGSILGQANRFSKVLGSGFIAPTALFTERPAEIIAVRGEKTAQLAQAGTEVLLGDPLSLADVVFPYDGAPEYELGLVPHISAVAHMRKICPPNIKLIDPAGEPRAVVRAIANCRNVMSQSLHGLIVADAYQRPNLWIAPSGEMMGGRFKFDDYFSTLDRDKQPHAFSHTMLKEPPLASFSVSHYRYDKKAYRDVLSASFCV